MIFRILLAIMVIIVFSGCNQPENTLIEATFDKEFRKQNGLTDLESKTWHYKDIVKDTIPGISLNRAYKEILTHKKAKTDVIMAIIDSGLDIEHEAIKDHIWINEGEIAGNKIDDDGNGYIDDVHGWNFLGNTSGENILYTNMEITRIVKQYQAQFKDKTEKTIASDELEAFQKYKQYLDIYNEALEKAKGDEKMAVYMIERLEQSQQFFKEKIGKTSCTLEELEKVIAQDSTEEKHIAFMRNIIVRNIRQQSYYDYHASKNNVLTYSMNLNYDDRELIGDDPYDITDINYGNNDIVGFSEKETHSTRVSGMTTSYKPFNKKEYGFSNPIKIMPIRLQVEGSAYDKDVALGIRYAVDNGAKVINMSFSKEYFTHKEWVIDAIKYAQEKDVLIVNSAGNKSLNIDKKEVYLDDTEINEIDNTVNNFIKVGASTPILDKGLIAFFSNYGKLKVDIFAPGDDIYTTWPNSEDRVDRGTSLSSSLVAGIAALIRVYYPDLSAAEVKDVILQSGISYDIMVNVPGTNNKEQKAFSELSKSGKVVNAYNALLMAEQVAKKK